MTQQETIEISVIIPVFNSEETIGACVEAVAQDSLRAKEIIVVDDGSTDGTREILSGLDCRVLETGENSGPAFARNLGVDYARGEILFFLDADLILVGEGVSMVERFFREAPGAVAAIGMYAEFPANEGFFPAYMALWRYCAWSDPLPEEFSFFTASCGAMRNEVFQALGGFDISYRGAEVEDYEFGHRLREIDRIHLLPELQGAHHFPDFWQCARNYFHRSRGWFELFLRRRKFDTGQANASIGLSVCLAVVVLLCVLFCLIGKRTEFVGLLVVSLAAYAVSLGRFVKASWRAHGNFFAIRSLGTHLVLSAAIAAGVGVAVIQIPFGWFRR